MELLILDFIILLYAVIITIKYIVKKDKLDRLEFNLIECKANFNKTVERLEKYVKEIRRLNLNQKGYRHPVTGKFVSEDAYFLAVRNKKD